MGFGRKRFLSHHGEVRQPRIVTSYQTTRKYIGSMLGVGGGIMDDVRIVTEVIDPNKPINHTDSFHFKAMQRLAKQLLKESERKKLELYEKEKEN